VVFSAILENAILNRNLQTPHDLRFPLKSQIILANKQSQTGTKILPFLTNMLTNQNVNTLRFMFLNNVLPTKKMLITYK